MSKIGFNTPIGCLWKKLYISASSFFTANLFDQMIAILNKQEKKITF